LRHISENPVRGVRRLADTKRRRFLSLDELARLGRAMSEAEHDCENRTALAAIKESATRCRTRMIRQDYVSYHFLRYHVIVTVRSTASGPS
jgi:hypothetical protein